MLIAALILVASAASPPPMLDPERQPIEQRFSSEHRCGDHLVEIEFSTGYNGVEITKPLPPPPYLRHQWEELKQTLRGVSAVWSYRVLCEGSDAAKLLIEGRESTTGRQFGGLSVSIKGNRFNGYSQIPSGN